MCSSADPTEQGLEQSQAAFTNTLQSAFSTTFAANQQILGTLSSTLEKAIANPQGFTPAEMTALRTNATDTVAGQTANAQRGAAAYGATHGGQNLGSGVQAQIQGQVATGGMQQLSGEQNQITVANAQQQQQNYWNAVSGLTNVGAAYNPTGYAGAETSAANSTTSAAAQTLAEQQSGWQDAFGVVSGVAGLGMAASKIDWGGGGSAPAPSNGYDPGGGG
jgi:hypothetical protein